MRLSAFLYLTKWRINKCFRAIFPEPVQTEAEVLRIVNESLRSQLSFAQKEIDVLVADSMAEINGEVLVRELMNLDSSNGWGVDYRPGVFARFEELKKCMAAIFSKYESFPVGSEPKGDFSYCLKLGKDGKPILYVRREVSMLNYQVFTQNNQPLGDLIDTFANAMFRTHINKIRVIHDA